MFGFNPLKSRIARSILYIATIGGLFSIFALAVFSIWNFFISPALSIGHINLLESLGIVCIFYIVFFSMKFAVYNEPHTKKNKLITHSSSSEEELFKKRMNFAFKQMSKKKIQNLNNSIIKCCGNPTFEEEFLKLTREYIKFHN